MSREKNRALIHSLNGASQKPEQLEFVETIDFGTHFQLERYRLNNGLNILLLEDHSAPTIAYQTWFKVGSRHEQDGKTGLSHLFEHLMFNEMEGMPPGEFDKKMEAAGIDNNASTWLDFTQYEESLPKGDLRLVVKLEAHRMGKLKLHQPQLDSEKEVVANERRFRVDDDIEGTIDEELFKLSYERHSYRWPTIGWMKDILDFQVEDLLQFYKNYYAPNNATIVAVGDFKPRQILKLIAHEYGDLESSTPPAEEVEPEPLQLHERRKNLRLPTPTAKVVVAYPGPALGDLANLHLNLACEVLAGGRASRLYQSLVRESELCIDVRADVGPHRHPGLIEFFLSGRNEKEPKELLEKFDEVLLTFLDSGFSAEELERATARSELGFYAGIESSHGKASSIGFYETVLEQPARGFERVTQMQSITPSDILFSARRYLRTKGRNIIIVEPKETE